MNSSEIQCRQMNCLPLEQSINHWHPISFLCFLNGLRLLLANWLVYLPMTALTFRALHECQKSTRCLMDSKRTQYDIAKHPAHNEMVYPCRDVRLQTSHILTVLRLAEWMASSWDMLEPDSWDDFGLRAWKFGGIFWSEAQ